MSVLSRLQRALEQLHDIDTDLDVVAYVVDAPTRDELPGARQNIPEQLFVREVDGEMELALYIDADVLQQLQADDPRKRLHDGNLDSHCIAVEGVSHFVLVAHRARHGRSISPLELEIQAEVDKFVDSWMLMTEQGASSRGAAAFLLRHLFERYEVRDELPRDEAERYHVASRVARGFCGSLLGTEDHNDTLRRIKQDVRAFRRRSLAEKMRTA